MPPIAPLNYAEKYSQALDQAYPYMLHFGELYATPNNNRFKWDGAKTIQVPTITTSGRVNSNRDAVTGGATRRFNNSWEPLTLRNGRRWKTSVHPTDVDETNYTATIANITRVFNEEQKFPEMDAYCVSKIYADWVQYGGTPDLTALDADNVLSVFNALMTNMSNARVPEVGRVLYVTPDVHSLIKMTKQVLRYADAKDAAKRLTTDIEAIDRVKVVPVPPDLMKTFYNFLDEADGGGFEVGDGALQINMLLVHPGAVITPIKYAYAQLDPPSAGSDGQFIYFEESVEDVFVLKNKYNGVQMNITAAEEPDEGSDET